VVDAPFGKYLDYISGKIIVYNYRRFMFNLTGEKLDI
jgi:hypothetical protein